MANPYAWAWEKANVFTMECESCTDYTAHETSEDGRDNYLGGVLQSPLAYVPIFISYHNTRFQHQWWISI